MKLAISLLLLLAGTGFGQEDIACPPSWKERKCIRERSGCISVKGGVGGLCGPAYDVPLVHGYDPSPVNFIPLSKVITTDGKGHSTLKTASLRALLNCPNYMWVVVDGRAKGAYCVVRPPIMDAPVLELPIPKELRKAQQ